MEKHKSDTVDAVVEIPTERLNEFHTGRLGHTFEVEYDEDMIELESQIISDGILENIIVRPEKEKPGEYEVIAGHRRRFLALKHRIPTMMCLVRADISDADAIKLMVVSNSTKRKHIKPSVIAKSYKAYMDANKRPRGGARGKGQVGQIGNTRAEAAEEFSVSEKQIRTYLHLNDLVPDLLELVDDGNLPITTAYELSFLDDRDQDAVYDEMVIERVKVSLEQAKDLHRMAKQWQRLSRDSIHNYLHQGKKNRSFRITEKSITEILPEEYRTLPAEEKYEFIKNAIASYMSRCPDSF